MAEIFEFETTGRNGERLKARGTCRDIMHAFECAQWWAEGHGVPDGAVILVSEAKSGSLRMGRFFSSVAREAQAFSEEMLSRWADL